MQYVLPQQVQLLLDLGHVLAQLSLLSHTPAQQIDTLCNQFPALRQFVFGRLVQLFKQLAELTGTRPRWNFYKYVIARDGTHAVAFNSMTGPQDKSFVAEVEKQLNVKLP